MGMQAFPLDPWRKNMHEKLQLRDQVIIPTNTQLEQVLGESFAAYEAFLDALPGLEINHEWHWYTPSKVWVGRGQHKWVTPRGTNKEKTLYWLYVFEGWFNVSVWFKEKNRAAILEADVSDKTRKLISDSKTYGKLPTFPVEFKIVSTQQLADIYVLIEQKKHLEK